MTQEEIQAIVNALPTGIQNVKSICHDKAVRYNVAGQQVGEGYKGIAIENGKKLLIK
jgi:hypothetical protein